MYVARLANGHIIKRMPLSGRLHAPSCDSHEWPALAAEPGHESGPAVVEDPVTGMTTLRLDFPLEKRCAAAAINAGCRATSSSRDVSNGLSLVGLLHHLWNAADLTLWKPSFRQKRTWAVVRSRLQSAADRCEVRGATLAARLYVPEPFSVAERESIEGRRLARWSQCLKTRLRARPLVLMIAELKALDWLRSEALLRFKHLPDNTFGMKTPRLERLMRLFAAEFSLWNADTAVRMIAFCTFESTINKRPGIEHIAVMTTCHEFLPIVNRFEQQSIAELIDNSRAFRKRPCEPARLAPSRAAAPDKH